LRVAHRNEDDAYAARAGNGGLLLRNGQWQSVRDKSNSGNE
jgi:hypothetical protein